MAGVDVIARRIRRLRQARGWTLRALGEKAHMAPSSISAIEVGRRDGKRLSAATCINLARALGVTADALMSLDEDEESPPVVVVRTDEPRTRLEASLL